MEKGKDRERQIFDSTDLIAERGCTNEFFPVNWTTDFTTFEEISVFNSCESCLPSDWICPKLRGDQIALKSRSSEERKNGDERKRKKEKFRSGGRNFLKAEMSRKPESKKSKETFIFCTHTSSPWSLPLPILRALVRRQKTALYMVIGFLVSFFLLSKSSSLNVRVWNNAVKNVVDHIGHFWQSIQLFTEGNDNVMMSFVHLRDAVVTIASRGHLGTVTTAVVVTWTIVGTTTVGGHQRRRVVGDLRTVVLFFKISLTLMGHRILVLPSLLFEIGSTISGIHVGGEALISHRWDIRGGVERVFYTRIRVGLVGVRVVILIASLIGLFIMRLRLLLLSIAHLLRRVASMSLRLTLAGMKATWQVMTCVSSCGTCLLVVKRRVFVSLNWATNTLRWKCLFPQMLTRRCWIHHLVIILQISDLESSASPLLGVIVRAGTVADHTEIMGAIPWRAAGAPWAVYGAIRRSGDMRCQVLHHVNQVGGFAGVFLIVYGEFDCLSTVETFRFHNILCH